MKLIVDKKADALYLRLNEGEVAESEQVAPGVVLDFDVHDNVIAIELLSLSKRSPDADLQRLLFETLSGPNLGESAVKECPAKYEADPE